MSSIYESSFKVLKTILKENEFFTIALKKNSNSIKKDEIVSVSSLCGLFLRNYYFIRVLVANVFNTTDVEPMIYIGLAYVNNSYKKIVDTNETLKFLANKLALYEIKVTDEVKETFNKVLVSKKDYLKEVFSNKLAKGDSQKTGFKYLSARNNLPEWVVKTLVKQYGRDLSIKTINAMTKMPKQFGYINSLLVKEITDDLKKDFKVVDGNFMEYTLTSSIRKNGYVRNGDILPLQVAEYEFLKSLPAINNGFIAYYFEEKEALYSMISNRYLPTNKVSLLTPSQKNNSELFTKINPSKPANLDIYNSDESGIISHLSEKQDLVVFMPKSSNLELLRRTPEYGILFDTNNLDGIIENELNGLSDITQYVKDGGYLAYAVSTFNIKETIILVKNFLSKHPEYTLEKEKIYFPFEKENSVFYFAIFKRK